jgi:hypothetical protein
VIANLVIVVSNGFDHLLEADFWDANSQNY